MIICPLPMDAGTWRQRWAVMKHQGSERRAEQPASKWVDDVGKGWERTCGLMLPRGGEGRPSPCTPCWALSLSSSRLGQVPSGRELKWLCSQNDSEGTFQHIRSEKQSARLHLPNWNSERLLKSLGLGALGRFPALLGTVWKQSKSRVFACRVS